MLLEARFPIMGTTAHIVGVGMDKNTMSGIETRLADLERRWTRFSPDSELSRLNAAAGSLVVVEPDTHRLITCAVDGWLLSAGRYDPTVGAAMKAIGYDRTFDDVETQGRVMTIPAPGCEAVELYPETSTVRLPRGVELDLGGIGKGFAADLICDEVLESGSAAGICVNLGGDVRVAGDAPTSDGWIVELARTASEDGAATIVGLSDGAVCTSTVSKRSWPGPDGDLHHLVDPSTGRPTGTDVTAISVVAGSATLAEVLTKSAMVGDDFARETIVTTGSAALALTASGQTVLIGPIEEYLR